MLFITFIYAMFKDTMNDAHPGEVDFLYPRLSCN